MIEIVRIHSGFGRWDELLDLIRTSFAYMDGIIEPPSSAYRLTPDLLERKAQDEIALAAIGEDRLLACVFLQPEAECLYVGKLAVAPDAQGSGLGRRLLSLAEDVARELALPALRLETRIELAGNHAAFGRLGFIRTSEKSHPGFDRVTLIEMHKALA